MLEARLVQGGLLKKVFDAIKEMVNEVNLECNDKGIQLQAMDTSHVSLVALDLKAEAFDCYRCDRPRSLGLNMTAVTKVFKLCNNEDTVLIRHEDDSDAVTFVFDSGNDSRVSNFELRLMRIDQEHLGVPETQSTATVCLQSRTFQRICADLSVIADSLTMKATAKAVEFSTAGDIGVGSIALRPASSSEEDVSIVCDPSDSAVSLTFAVRYLIHFSKASPLASKVELRLTKDTPLEVTFQLNDNPDIGHLKFYLAPKMDDEAGESAEAAD